MLCPKKLVSVLAQAFLLLSSSILATAQIAFNDFSNTTGLVINPAAQQVGNVLRITPAGQQHVSGSAWFADPQSVANGFTSTFKFRITQEGPAADGLAFVIQNSGAGVEALGGSGGAIGYGVPDVEAGDTGTPIDHSLAVEIDTYQNQWDPDNNHIAVQSCGTAPNTQDHSNESCFLGIFSPGESDNLSDGQVHTMVVEYDPAASLEGTGTLRIYLDDFGQPVITVQVNLASLLGLPVEGTNAGKALVGFTGGTGAITENGDILSWAFTPATAETTITQTLPQATNTQTDINYVFGSYNHKVEYFNSTSDNNVSVTAIPIDQLAFHNSRLAGTPFSGADCAIYQGTGDQCVLFRVTCNSGADCSTLDYDLFNNFNSDFTITGAGVLKAPIGTNEWQNIIKTFVQTRLDPGTRSGSKGFSDFIIVQNATAAPTFSNVSPANGATYSVGQTVPVAFQCDPDPNAPLVTLTNCSGTLTAPGLGTTAYNATTPAGTGNSLSFSGTTITFTQPGPGTFALTSSDSVLNTSNRTAMFNVVLAPQATINPTTLNFGTVRFLTLWTKFVTVKNVGTLPLAINGVQVVQGTSDWDDYFFINFCPSTLGVGKSCPIAVFFFADDLGLRTATLKVFNNSTTNPLQVNLTGNVVKK